MNHNIEKTELYEFLIGSRSRMMDEFSSRLDKIKTKQDLLYKALGHRPESIDLLSEVSELSNICIDLIAKSYGLT